MLPDCHPMNNDSLAKEFQKQMAQLLDQSMDKILHCLEQLDDRQLWWRPQPQLNSIGNQLLHAAGNLRQWSTVALAGLVDDRDRDNEFSVEQDISKQDLLQHVTSTVMDAKCSIAELPTAKLLESLNVQGFDVSYLEAITHTCAHFQGHTHQIILMTRIQIGDDYRFQWSPEHGRDSLPM